MPREQELRSCCKYSKIMFGKRRGWSVVVGLALTLCLPLRAGQAYFSNVRSVSVVIQVALHIVEMKQLSNDAYYGFLWVPSWNPVRKIILGTRALYNMLQPFGVERPEDLASTA